MKYLANNKNLLRLKQYNLQNKGDKLCISNYRPIPVFVKYFRVVYKQEMQHFD